jgi:hypothetical protein
MADEALSIQVKLDVDGAKGDAKKLADSIDRSMTSSGKETKKTTDGLSKGLDAGVKGAEKVGDTLKKGAEKAKPLHDRLNAISGKISAVTSGGGLSGFAGALGAAGPWGAAANAGLQVASAAAQTLAPKTYDMVSGTFGRAAHGVSQALGLGGMEAQATGRMKAEEVVTQMAAQYGEAGVKLSDLEMRELMRQMARNTARGAEQAQRAQSLWINEYGYTGTKNIS